MRVRRLAALLAAAALTSASCSAAPEPPVTEAARSRLGLMTTLPLLWAEAADIGEIVRAEATPGWVRAALERRFAIVPLDTLDAAALAGLDRLLLAQPRALGPAENVALDDWVRAGGRVLLFADPLLTRHSRFAVGDPRRPQDVALLSPILARWGLELRFDDSQPEGERNVSLAGIAAPVNAAGELHVTPGATCEVAGDSMLARCRIGTGSAIVVADAALLDDGETPGAAEARRTALLALLDRAVR